MRVETVVLTEEENGAYLDAYVAAPLKAFVRKAILILPGGAYRNLSERESEPIAQAFMPYGYNAFVLHYTVGKESGKPFPAQLVEATLAIKHIKDHAAEYGIDPEELFVIGFSAGGHLAGATGTMWKYDAVKAVLGDSPRNYTRPKGVMLMYPMISPDYSNCEKYTNAWGTLFCCDTPSEEQLRMAAIEKNVDAESSPAFVLHTFADRTVDVRNVMALGMAYADAGVPFEMHVYPSGPHGLSVANEITAKGRPQYIMPNVAEWVRLAAAWAEHQN